MTSIKRRIKTLEESRQEEPSIIVARHGYIEPKPGQTVIGNGYWLHNKENKEGGNHDQHEEPTQAT